MSNPRRVEPLYRSVMLQLELRRRELGLPQWQVDELAGTAERYFPKALWASTPSGRQAQWRQVQDMCEALFGADFEVIIRPGGRALRTDDDLRAVLDEHSKYSKFSLRYEPLAAPDRAAAA